MAQSLEELASVVETLLGRLDALEAALKRDRTTPHIDIDVRLAQMRAVNDYYRREGLQQMAAEPELLAVVRARRARVNAYLEERGLPPEPDPYHELP